MADETFAEWPGWAQGHAEGLLHSNSLGLHPNEICSQLTHFAESPELQTPGFKPAISKYNIPFPEISTTAQELQKLTLHAQMQDNAKDTGCLIFDEPYEQVKDERAAD